LTKHFNWDHDL